MFGETPEVLVVGAGPVGLFAALTLRQRGIRVQVIDTGVWACQHSYGLALHPQSLQLFDEFGMTARILEASYPVRRIGLHEPHGRRAEIRLGDGHEDKSCLAVVRQDVLETLLEQKLEELGVRVCWRHEATTFAALEDCVQARVNRLERDSRGYAVAHAEWVVDKSFQLEVPFIIGADGYNSLVRRTLGIAFPEVADAQYYAVFECKTGEDLGDELRLTFGPGTIDALWPLPGSACRWCFQLPDFHDTEAEQRKDRLLDLGFGYFPTERIKDREPGPGDIRLPVLEESRLRALIAERAAWFSGGIEGITWRTVIRFERRLANRFGQGRMWLAGDSAHLTGPAGVQSMNTGLFEARDLAATLARILRQGASPRELPDYGARWTARWRQLHSLDGGLRARPDADPWIGGNAGRLMSCLPAHGEALAPLAGQLNLDA